MSAPTAAPSSFDPLARDPLARDPLARAPLARGPLARPDRWRAGVVVGLAILLRLALFPFAENKLGDAPIRALLAERMNDDPAAATDPHGFLQFGPLPIEVMRPFLALDLDARRSSRVPSLLAGLAVFWPFFTLARRMTGRASAAVLATLALSLSPLHLQASTTAASEALYLLLFVAACERLHAAIDSRRRLGFVVAGLFASLAAVSRYDAWLALPAAAAAAFAFGPRDRRALFDLALFLGVAALLPAAYLAWHGWVGGDPFFFARFISRDHASLGAAEAQRLGGAFSRIRQMGIWTISFVAAMTPVLFISAVVAAVVAAVRAPVQATLPTERTWRLLSPATGVVLVAALTPPALYLVKGLVFGDFLPLARFALAPGVLLLPLAAAALLSVRVRVPHPTLLVVLGALLVSGVTSLLAFARADRIWLGAEALAPITRLDAEDRAVARHLERHRGPTEAVFIDPLGFADIAIAHAAHVPVRLSATSAHTRSTGPTIADTRARTGASWFAAHDASWGRAVIPDWPRESSRFGHWRVARATAP